MVRRKPRRKPLGTISEIPDELWRRIEPILTEFSAQEGRLGRHVANWPGDAPCRSSSDCGAVASGTNCPSGYGTQEHSSHDWFQRWAPGQASAGRNLRRCSSPSVDEARAGSGRQSAAGPTPMRGEARVRGKRTGKNPTEAAARKAPKESLVADGDGGPLWCWSIAGANVLEQRLLQQPDDRGVLVVGAARADEGISQRQHAPGRGVRRSQRGREAAAAAGYAPHSPPRSARRRRAATDRRATSRGDGWSSGPSHGCRSAAGSWCGTTRRTSTTSR